jgi:UDP-N-acetylmuramoyl-tripeptide--D-alanyl-D-alanine ligase
MSIRQRWQRFSARLGSARLGSKFSFASILKAFVNMPTRSGQESDQRERLDSPDIPASQSRPRAVVAWGGDVNLGRRQHYRTHELGWDAVLPNALLRTADLMIVNLECVVATSGELGVPKGERAPYYFRARPEMLRLLTAAGVGLVATANNHSGDYGSQALLEQAFWLNAEGIGHAGSGPNREIAFSPAYGKAGDWTVALFSIDATQRGFAADEATAGHAFLPLNDPAAWFATLAPRIQEARKRAHIVLVAVHWGPNLARMPAADEIACGHALIDAGADAVLGASAHVLQGVEVYQGRPIIHDAGDLLFDAVSRSATDSGLFALEIDARGVHGLRFTPLSAGFGRTTQQEGEAARQASQRFINLCNALPDNHAAWKLNGDGSCSLDLFPTARVTNHSTPAARETRPRWSVDTIPSEALLAEPMTFGALQLLGVRARVGEKSAPSVVFVDSYWTLLEPTDCDWRLELRAAVPGGDRTNDWGRSSDHDPCDWMCPTSQWKPGRVYHDQTGLRPPGVVPTSAASLQLFARIVSSDARTALIPLPRHVVWQPRQNVLPKERSSSAYNLLPLDQLPPDGDSPDAVWTAGQLRAVTGGVWLAAPPAPGWTSDAVTNRKEQVKDAQARTLYVAHDYDTLWPHERFSTRAKNSYDRHRLVPELAPKLAGAIVKTRVPGVDPDFPQLQVEDPIKALVELGAMARRRMRGHVVAVTGSSGKSTVCAMLAHAFGEQMRVRASRDNYNSRVGIMQSLAGAPRATDMMILETAVSAINAPRFEFIKLARPDVAIITNISASHMKAGQTTRDIARRKANIFEGMAPGSSAVICADTEHADLIVSKARERGLRVLTYGVSEAADLQIASYDFATGGIRLHDYGTGITHRYRLDASGLHMAINSVACIAVAKVLELSFPSVTERLLSFESLDGRGKVSPARVGNSNIEIIDESYNANPISMLATIESFALAPASARKVLVLGDMLELGDRSRELHLDLANAIANCKPALVYLCGENMGHLVRPLTDQHKLAHVRHFTGLADLSDGLEDDLQDGDSVLVKGSNGIGLWKWVQKVASAGKACASVH